MGLVETDKLADKAGAVIVPDFIGIERKPHVEQKLVGRQADRPVLPR